MSTTSATTQVWFILVDHKHEAIGLDEVTVPDTLSVAGLRTKIQEKAPRVLADVDALRLTVFECTDSSIDLKDSDERRLPNKLEKIFSSNAVEQVGSTRMIASLQLANKALIIRVPGALHVHYHLFCTQVLRHYRYPAERAQARRRRRRRSFRNQASEARTRPRGSVISSSCLRIQPGRRTRQCYRLQPSLHLRFSPSRATSRSVRKVQD
jgi:hypothetical protein